MKVCSLLGVSSDVTRQFCHPFSSTDFILELKILILFFMLSVDLHTDLRVMKAFLDFQILSLKFSFGSSCS